MAKKRKPHHKKHSYPKQSVAAVQPATKVAPKVASAPSIQANPRPTATVMNFDPAIGGDIWRTFILAGSLMGLQLALWLLLKYTSLGATVYGWIRL